MARDLRKSMIFSWKNKRTHLLIMWKFEVSLSTQRMVMCEVFRLWHCNNRLMRKSKKRDNLDCAQYALCRLYKQIRMMARDLKQYLGNGLSLLALRATEWLVWEVGKCLLWPCRRQAEAGHKLRDSGNCEAGDFMFHMKEHTSSYTLVHITTPRHSVEFSG